MFWKWCGWLNDFLCRLVNFINFNPSYIRINCVFKHGVRQRIFLSIWIYVYVYILNKIKGEYSVLDFKQFAQQTNVSIDFASVQAIFLGNQALKQQGNEKLLKGKEFHLLTKEISNFIIDSF